MMILYRDSVKHPDDGETGRLLLMPSGVLFFQSVSTGLLRTIPQDIVSVNVRAVRQSVGLSTAQFAESLGLSVVAVSSYDQGRRNVPPIFLSRIRSVEYKQLSLCAA